MEIHTMPVQHQARSIFRKTKDLTKTKKDQYQFAKTTQKFPVFKLEEFFMSKEGERGKKKK